MNFVLKNLITVMLSENAKINLSIILLTFGFVFSLGVTVDAQNSPVTISASSNKVVKWQIVNGGSEDFFFAMLDGGNLFTDSTFRLNDVFDARVDSFKRLNRTINGVAFSITMYEGRARNVSELLLKTEAQRINKPDSDSSVKETFSYQEKAAQDAPVLSGFILSTVFDEGINAENKNQNPVWQQKNARNEKINGFECNFFTLKSADLVGEKQYFLKQNKLYVVKAYSRSETNTLYRRFWESIRLVNNGKVLSPNLPNAPTENLTTAKLKLPAPVLERNFDETHMNLMVDGVTVDDSQAAILFVPTPATSDINSIFDDISAKIKAKFGYKLKLSLLANGKVGSVEILERNVQKSAAVSNAVIKKLEDNLTKAFESTGFIPAEKSGKAVSTQKIVSYSIEIQH